MNYFPDQDCFYLKFEYNCVLSIGDTGILYYNIFFFSSTEQCCLVILKLILGLIFTIFYNLFYKS